MHNENGSNDDDCHIALDRGARTKYRRLSRPQKKVLGFVLVGIMVISSVAMITPSLDYGGSSDQEVAASIEYGGSRTTNMTVSGFFESYLKPTDYSELGKHARTASNMGVNSWMDLRGPGYGEYFLRNEYPIIGAYAPYSTVTTPAVDVGYIIYAPYKIDIEADNVRECNTTYYDATNNGDPNFVPLRGAADQAGGWINMSLYMTYLTSQEMTDIRSGSATHYANSYYGVPNLVTPGSGSDDGYWHELQGYFDFNRESATKFLNLPDTGDLRDDWNSTTTSSAYGHDIEYDWFDEWMAEGSSGGEYDIYTAYDFNNDLRMLRNILDWRNSTADSIRIRIWSMSWGNDVLMPRYLEAANVSTGWGCQLWYEDWYLNATIGPEMADFETSGYGWYSLGAWKDPDVFMGSWTVEPEHIDWTRNVDPGGPVDHTTYPSAYNDYAPEDYPAIRKPSYVPGTTQYGNNVTFWVPPLIMNLTDGEKLEIQLPSATTDIFGYTPYVGASDDISVAAKRDEINSNGYWGEMVLGNCNPSMDSYYDPATKIVTINGPFDAWTPRIPNGADSSKLEGGCPSFSFAVSNVSDYTVAIESAAEYVPGIPYTLTITAKNLSATTVTGWNGTVNLECTDSGATFGASSHAFVPATDSGVWTTTVTFSQDGTWNIYANDSWFPLDVNGMESGGVTVVPEFPVILIPIIGAIAMFLVVRSTSKRRKEE